MMTGDSINRWLTLGANIGVLIGIILLLIELDQNATMIQGQTRNDVSAELVDLISQVANNPQLADLLNRGENGEELTEQERRQFLARQIANIRYFENVHYQFRQGLYGESEYATQRIAWRRGWTQSRHDFWCSYRETVSPDFRADFDNLLAEYSC